MLPSCICNHLRIYCSALSDFNHQKIQRVGVSSVLDAENNARIQEILARLNIPIVMAQVHAEYAQLKCGYEQPAHLESIVGYKFWRLPT